MRFIFGTIIGCLIALNAYGVYANELFEIKSPANETLKGLEKKFGKNTNQLFENLSKGLWLDNDEGRVIVVAVLENTEISKDDLEAELYLEIDNLILAHIGNIPKFIVGEIPFKAPALRRLSAKLAHQLAVDETKKYSAFGRIPYRNIEDGKGKMVFEISSLYFDTVEDRVNKPDWVSIRRKIVRSLIKEKDIGTLVKILEVEARFIDIIIVQEYLNPRLLEKNKILFSSHMDPIEYAKKAIFSFQDGLAFSGPPKSFIKPLIKGHRLYDSLVTVVSRLPLASFLTGINALKTFKAPLGKIYGGSEFYKIISSSFDKALPLKIKSLIARSQSHAVKHVAKSSGFVIFDDLGDYIMGDKKNPAGTTGSDNVEPFLEISKNPNSLTSYIKLSNRAIEDGDYLLATALLQFILLKEPWNMTVRQNLSNMYSKLGAIKLAEGVNASIYFDDIGHEIKFMVENM
jgi:hypothetical protein